MPSHVPGPSHSLSPPGIPSFLLSCLLNLSHLHTSWLCYQHTHLWKTLLYPYVPSQLPPQYLCSLSQVFPFSHSLVSCPHPACSPLPSPQIFLGHLSDTLRALWSTAGNYCTRLNLRLYRWGPWSLLKVKQLINSRQGLIPGLWFQAWGSFHDISGSQNGGSLHFPEAQSKSLTPKVMELVKARIQRQAVWIQNPCFHPYVRFFIGLVQSEMWQD